MTDYAERVATDSGLRLDLQVARGWGGTRPTLFLDWIQTGTGWSETDRELARALYLYESQLCVCGGYLPETTKAENEERYRTQLAAKCHRCVAEHIAREARAEGPYAYAEIFTTQLVTP